MVEYRSSRLDQNKPFSGPVSTLLSSSADSTVSACPVAYAPLDLFKLALNCKDRETLRFKVFRVNAKNAKELCTKISTIH